jgi:hypothetical protein
MIKSPRTLPQSKSSNKGGHHLEKADICFDACVCYSYAVFLFCVYTFFEETN